MFKRKGDNPVPTEKKYKFLPPSLDSKCPLPMRRQPMNEPESWAEEPPLHKGPFYHTST